MVMTSPLSSQGIPPGRRLPTIRINGYEAVEGEVLVRYRDQQAGVARARAEQAVDADDVEIVNRRGLRRMHSRRHGTRTLLDMLRTNPDVEWAEPNYVIRVDAVPNDPFFGSLWGLFNSGQDILGTAGVAGADVGASAAWDATTGSRSNVVGVVDTGIDYNHPDLAANVWSAPTAFSVTIGGVVINCAAGTHGFNAILNTCDPMDDHDHGTHVSGTIGAVGNNGMGVAGVNWVASIMGLKFLADNGFGLTSDAIKAIEFAIQAKAAFAGTGGANVRVLSNSWAGAGFSQALLDEIDRANTNDMLFVAAAGNDASNNDAVPTYPAAFNAPNLIAVAATDNQDQRASFSNYGAWSVHLAAPGASVLSTTRSNTYQYFNGTSMATPHVSGAAALILASCQMTTASLKAALLNSVDPLAALAGLTATGGKLNVSAALRNCATPQPTVSASAAGRTITVTVADGPAHPKDWVGLYCPATAADTAFTASQYLNGSITPPITGVSSASLVFTAPAAAPTCNARLFLNNGYTRLATSGTVSTTVTPTMAVTTPMVSPGGVISVVIANGPADPTDWVGLFSTTAGDISHQQWSYLNGFMVPPVAGRTGATLQFVAPTVPGSYNLRLFANNTYSRLATSNTVTVAPVPTLTINDVSATEGDSGTTTATFTVSLSPVNATQSVTVAYATANGTTSDGDYLSTSGTLTFSPSTATQTIHVSVNSDAVFEPTETFVVNLSNPVNAVMGDGQGVGRITDDDASTGPAIGVTTSVVNPGATISFFIGNGPANPTDWVGLFATTDGDTSFRGWAYLNGLKVAPAAGESSATLQLVAPTIPGTYELRLFSNNGYTRLATSSAITVSPPIPTLTINDVSLAEGTSNVSTAIFTVSLSPQNASQTVTVAYATADGSALVSNGDYLAATGTLTFGPSVVSRTISVTMIADSSIEPNETFAVNLSSPTNAVIGDTQGIGTIIDDDGPAVLLNTSHVRPGETITFTVANGPRNVRDWVALCPRTASDTAFVDWAYLNGLKVAPMTAAAAAELQFVAPAVPGDYNIRFFANNGYGLVATSATITVSP